MRSVARINDLEDGWLSLFTSLRSSTEVSVACLECDWVSTSMLFFGWCYTDKTLLLSSWLENVKVGSDLFCFFEAMGRLVEDSCSILFHQERLPIVEQGNFSELGYGVSSMDPGDFLFGLDRLIGVDCPCIRCHHLKETFKPLIYCLVCD